MNKQDLLLASNPSGDADAKLIFDLDATATTAANVVVEAMASDTAEFSCGQTFNSTQSASVMVQ